MGTNWKLTPTHRLFHSAVDVSRFPRRPTGVGGAGGCAGGGIDECRLVAGPAPVVPSVHLSGQDLQRGVRGRERGREGEREGERGGGREGEGGRGREVAGGGEGGREGGRGGATEGEGEGGRGREEEGEEG